MGRRLVGTTKWGRGPRGCEAGDVSNSGNRPPLANISRSHNR